MTRARAGDKSDIGGKSGVFKVVFQEVAEENLKATEDRPEAFRVTFKVVGEDQTVSLGVPVSDAGPIAPFVEKGQVQVGNLNREWLSANLKGEYTVRVWNNFIQEVLAPAGTWLFTELKGIWPFQRKSDGARRLRFTIAREDGAVTSWTCRDPELVCSKGKTPADDHIGDERELNPNQTAFGHLIDLGLDWERFLDEVNDAEKYPALWPDHVTLDGDVESLFEDLENPWKTLPGIVKNHGAQAVQVTVNDHEQYGLGPERTGTFPIAKLTPVIVKGDDGFAAEREYMLELWNNLTAVILQKDTRFVMPSGKFTADGLQIAKGIMVPVVTEWPSVVKKQKDDGSPLIAFPIEREEWAVDGLACLSMVAERLMKLPQEEIVDPTGVCALTDNGKIVAWVRENVPELEGDMGMAEKEVL